MYLSSKSSFGLLVKQETTEAEGIAFRAVKKISSGNSSMTNIGRTKSSGEELSIGDHSRTTRIPRVGCFSEFDDERKICFYGRNFKKESESADIVDNVRIMGNHYRKRMTRAIEFAASSFLRSIGWARIVKQAVEERRQIVKLVVEVTSNRPYYANACEMNNSGK